MPSPFGIAPMQRYRSATCLPSAPPKSHFPKRTSLSPETSDSLRLARNR